MNAANAPIQASSLENERRAHEPSMEEILASIRKIIADDEALPLTRSGGELRSSFTTPKPFETNVAPFAAKAPESSEPSGGLEAREEVSQNEPVARQPADHSIFAEPVPAPAIVAETHEETHPEPVATRIAPPRLDDADMQSFAEIAHELAAHDLRPAPADEPPVVAAIDDQSDDEAFTADIDQVEDLAPEVVTEISHRFEQKSSPAYAVGNGATFGATVVPAPEDQAAMLSPESDASISSAFRALSASVQLNNSEVIDRHVRDLLRPMLKQWLDDNLPVMVERMVRAEIERVARGGR